MEKKFWIYEQNILLWKYAIENDFNSSSSFFFLENNGRQTAT